MNKKGNDKVYLQVVYPKDLQITVVYKKHSNDER